MKLKEREFKQTKTCGERSRTNSAGSTKTGEIPEGWGECSLGDVADFRNGKSSPQRHDLSDYEVFGSNGVIGRSADYNSPEGTIIVGRVGSYCGSVYFSKNRCWVTDNAIIGFPRENSDARYLYYLLLNLNLNNHRGGSGQPLLNQGILNSIAVCVPPLSEQRMIAKILGDLDEKIELNHRMNKTLEAIAQALFKRWFVEREDAKDYCSVADLIEFDPQVTAKKGEVLPYVDMKALSTEGMGVDEIVFKPFSGGSKFQNNDTLFARITPCLENGKTAFVNFLHEENPVGFGSTEFIVMRSKEGISPQFVYCLARHPEFRFHAIQSMVGSSGRQRVQLNMLKSYEIFRPYQGAMEKFDKATLPLFLKTNENRNEIKSLSQIRDSLLPKLMSGKIRIKSENQVMSHGRP